MITKISCCVMLVIIGFTLWGCVDVPSQGQLPPDYHALARFIHVATDTSSSTVTVDGSSIGSLSFGGNTGYVDLLAGGRNLQFAGTTQNQVFRSNSQNSVLIYALSGSKRFLNLDEGYSFANNFTANGGTTGNALVRLVNVATGSAPTINFYSDSANGTEIKGNVSFATAPGYTQLSAASYTFVVVSNGGYMAAPSGSEVTPSVTTRSTGVGSFDLSLADGLVYTITLKSDVKDSFYTAAHFHFGAAGTDGSIAQAIDVSAQTITFPAVTLSGANETPTPVTTTAIGSGTFKLTRDGLEYTIGVARDTSGRLFVAGHFHNAAAGVSGPVVRNLITGPVGDTTLTGIWKSSDAQPLTAALLTQLLAGRIYVNFHSVAFPSGEIRAQLIPDSLSTNVFSGSWADIPDSVKDSIDVGHTYINFHTLRNPGGQVRGQIVVDPAKGHYGVSAPFTTTFATDRMYTLAVTGSSKTIGMQVWLDRQLGLSKSSDGKSSTGQLQSTRK